MTRKKITALALTLVLIFSLAACGGPAPSQDPEPSAAAPAQETPAETLPLIGTNILYDPNQPINEGKDIEVEFWYWTGAANLFQSLADQYTAVHPNVTIKLVENPWDDYFTKLPLALQGNDGPAIFNVHNSKHDILIDYMAPYDIPLEEMEADFVGVSGHVVDGEVYYTDYGLMTATMYYNTDMWAAAGLTDADIPTTWDQFREVAKKLTIRDEKGELVQAGFSYNGGIQGDVLGMQYQYGQNLFNEDGTIQTVTPTLRGVGISPASSLIQLDRYSFMSGGGTFVDFLDTQKPFDGWFVNLPRPQTWVEYEDIDFGNKAPKKIRIRYRSEAGAAMGFSAEENKDFATVKFPSAKTWTEITAPMDLELTGICNVHAAVNSGDIQIDWITFE